MKCIVVMGVAGSGKSTVGRSLATRLGCDFVEGDDHHPAANVAKMSSGIPLEDKDRDPWFEAIARFVTGRCELGVDWVVLACSTLKASYRRRLDVDLGGVDFVFLDVDRAEAHRRLSDRDGHFMGPEMIDSQFAALERPNSNEALVIDAESASVEDIVDRIVAYLGAA